MNTAFLKNLSLLLLFILISSFVLFERKISLGSSEFFEFETDSLVVGNRTINTGSKIMTDQDALMILPPSGSKLSSIELYFSSISTNVSDSSRLWVKRQRSWSCAPLGNANPFQWDQYTLGQTQNIPVQVGWNKYIFEQPIDISSDTIYIWPDLIQQIQPRIDYASGNDPDIWNVNSFLCASPPNDLHPLDYRCELVFTQNPPCPPVTIVTNSDSVCYAGDTIEARAVIQTGKSITYLSSDLVTLDTSFEVQSSAYFEVDMSGCDN